MLIRPSVLVFLAAACGCCGAVFGQYAERGSLVGSGAPDVDASGRSVKNPRVRAIHTEDPTLAGGTADLIRRDPYLAYQLGRNLCFREFRERDGVFDGRIANLDGPKLDRSTAKITAQNQTGCSGCHNQPYGNPGGGNTFAKDSGRGRQAPHFYGAGIVEMLALQVRTKILREVDTDNDGWISAGEAAASPERLRVSTGVGSAKVDFGSARLSDGSTGVPELNHIFRIWYGKEEGGRVEIVPDASSLDGEETTHYNFAMIVWGWGQLVPPSALNPTNRAFLWDPFKAHSGLESHDPSSLDDSDGDGVSEPTLAGAVQFPATHRPPDPGTDLDPLGFSRDDPDHDGHLNEISEGDLDLSEWFLLNAPRPAFAGKESEYQRGVQLMETLECASCHVPDWRINGRNEPEIVSPFVPGHRVPMRGIARFRKRFRSGPPRTDPGTESVHRFAGDRRFFDLDVRWSRGRLEGRLVELVDTYGERLFGAFVVHGIFSDLRHHDMGDGFQETGYDGNVNRIWRTPPLWGVGSGFPWGHDGVSLTLEQVILRHGGDATRSRGLYAVAPRGMKDELIGFLRKLQVYDIESLPTDIDGDSVIQEHFPVLGVDTGRERFNAEWLFRTPVLIQGMVENTQGQMIRSFAAVNLDDAYGLDLELRRDSDLDGWPDVWDHAPGIPGFKDGVND